jgi:uncharacterized protein DUF4932
VRALLVLLLAVACGKSSSPPPAPTPTPSPTPMPTTPSPEIHVDRRAETLAILELLAGAPEYQLAAPTAYVADVKRELGPFATHAAVAATRELRAKHGIAFEQPMALAIHLDAGLALAQPVADLDARWKAVDLDAYLAQVRAFAADAKLDAFFAAHQRYVAAVEDRFRAAVEKENPTPWFGDFFGAAGARFTVVPALLQGPHNYGVRAGDAMYQLMGLGVPDADELPVVDDAVLETVVHEMAHSFVNPVIERHLAELEPAAAPLYKLVAPQMEYLQYGSTKIMLFESVVRAITTLYIRDRKGDQAAADATRGEVRRGFVWTAELADVLAKHHATKSRDLDAAVPKLVELFGALAKRYEHGLPPMAFLGPIDAVFRTPFAIVHAPDPAVTAYATAVREKLFKGNVALASATPQVFDDHPHVGLVAYGTAASNPVVANVIERSGIAITDDAIAVGRRRFTGPGLVLLACWPRTDDPSKGIVIYTAARDALVPGINGVHAGGTDWVVARRRADGGYDTLAQGDFPHAADGAWTLP